MDDFRLRVFITAAKTLNFTKCAEQLYISQPAVSKHIGELESRYKVQLFERSGSRVTFHRSLLKAVEIDLADCPDLGPVLIALGCFCSGTTIIRNAGRLRIKECDRIAAMQEELAKMGGTVKADGDTLTIEGCALHKPTAPLNGHNDHRIVMAMAVAALAAGQPAVIEGANAVNKSWPDFFEVIKGLGAHVTNQG